MPCTFKHRLVFHSQRAPLFVHCNSRYWNCHCFRYDNRVMHHVVLRHGNVTSVRDVVLVSLVCTLLSIETFAIR